jgi:hypothetical protein
VPTVWWQQPAIERACHRRPTPPSPHPDTEAVPSGHAACTTFRARGERSRRRLLPFVCRSYEVARALGARRRAWRRPPGHAGAWVTLGRRPLVVGHRFKRGADRVGPGLPAQPRTQSTSTRTRTRISTARVTGDPTLSIAKLRTSSPQAIRAIDVQPAGCALVCGSRTDITAAPPPALARSASPTSVIPSPTAGGDVVIDDSRRSPAPSRSRSPVDRSSA